MKHRANQAETLESKIELEIGNATKSIETLISSLSSLKTALNSTINSTETNKLKSNVDSSVKTVDVLKKALNFGGMIYGLKKGWDIVSGLAQANMDMTETANLFEVQMGKVVDQYGNLDEAQSQYYTRAMAFQDQMNEKLATNKSELMKYQAMYFGMLQPQLKNDDLSYRMSESLTKAGYDIASLYNLSIDTAMNKLKSGLAGQIESLRQIGIDVSESSLSQILDQVGIDRSVQKLSYAEKEVARYIAIMQQAGKAQGDFARTFESGANQVRVFQNQLAELRQVAGAFFMGLFGQILPIVNGIIMAIKELLKALAKLFGFDLNLSSSGSSNLSTGVGNVSTGASNAGKNLDKATKKAKEFKKQLMGFDEINNIEKPTESSGGSGSSGSGGAGGIGGGIDPKLLDAFKEWDNMMDKISGKAQKIRDAILDWLGVTDGSFRNLKKIWEVVQAIGLAFAGWKISKKILDFLQNLGLLKNLNAFQMQFGIALTIGGIWAMWKGTKRLLEGDVDVFSLLETFLGMGAGTFGIVNILRSLKNGAGSKIFSLGESFKIGLGVMLVIQGFEVLKEGIEKKDLLMAVAGALEIAGGLFIGVKAILGNEAITSAISKISKSVKSFSDTLNIAYLREGSFTGALKSMISPATLVKGTIVILIARLVELYATSENFRNGLSRLWEVIKAVGDFLNSIFKGALKEVGEMFSQLLSPIKGVVEWISQLSIVQAVSDWFGGLGEACKILDLGFGDLAITIGGALLVITGLNPILGAIVLAFEAVTVAIRALGLGSSETSKEMEELGESYKKTKSSIEDKLNSTLSELEVDKKLANQLEGLVDANGKVTDGNEARVKTILGSLNKALGTQYELEGNVIKQNGEEVKSYDELKSSIEKVIESKKQEAKANAYQEAYEQALKQQIELDKKKNDLQKEYVERMGKYKEMAQYLTDHPFDASAHLNFTKAKNEVIDTEKAMGEWKEQYKEVCGDIVYYDDQLTQALSENSETTAQANQQIADSTAQTAEQVKMSLDQLSADMITSGQVTQEQFATMITEGGTALQDMVQNNVDKWNELYAVADTAQQASMLAQSTTLATWSPQLQQQWADMAQNSATDFANGISSVDNDVKAKILSSISKTESLTPEMVNAWSNLATESADDFREGIKSLDDDTKGKLLASIGAVNGLNETSREAFANLSENGKKAFNDHLASLDEDEKAKVLAGIIAVDGLTEENRRTFDSLSDQGKQAFNNAMQSLDADARNKVQSAINQINAQQGYGGQAGGNVGGAIVGDFNRETSKTGDSANNFLRGFINVITLPNPLGIFGFVGNLASKIISKFNKGLDEHSPSKETAKSAENFIKGFTNQIDIMENGTLRQVQSLGQNLTKEFDDNLGISQIESGIKVNPKDFSVNTNQFIDYGAINGQIQTQSNIKVNGNIADKVAQASYNAFVRAMQDEGIHIEARTDEGVIVKKVTKGIDDFVTQTGELPFRVPT